MSQTQPGHSDKEKVPTFQELNFCHLVHGKSLRKPHVLKYCAQGKFETTGAQNSKQLVQHLQDTMN
jgi:hypothetical protein